MRLEWPLDKATMTVTNAHETGLMPSNWDNNLYRGDWDGATAIFDYDHTTMDHWAPPSWGYAPLPEPTPGAKWWGIDTQQVAKVGTDWEPMTTWHNMPVLWLVAANPAVGPDDGVAEGMSTEAYKETIIIPQNLRLASGSATAAGKIKFKGTLAINPLWIGGADGPIVWAPAGQKVKIQEYVGGKWKTRATATVTGTSGAWSVSFMAKTANAKYRAYWEGTASPTPVERSQNKRVIL
jgi:hypothetical protein